MVRNSSASVEASSLPTTWRSRSAIDQTELHVYKYTSMYARVLWITVCTCMHVQRQDASTRGRIPMEGLGSLQIGRSKLSRRDGTGIRRHPSTKRPVRNTTVFSRLELHRSHCSTTASRRYLQSFPGVVTPSQSLWRRCPSGSGLHEHIAPGSCPHFAHFSQCNAFLSIHRVMLLGASPLPVHASPHGRGNGPCWGCQ